MLKEIQGLHHITSMASDANTNNQFFTKLLGLRRVKKTVNFDRPDVYHLYYGDENGTPGSVMTYFPFPNLEQGRKGAGEVGTTAFSIPDGAVGFWQDRLTSMGLKELKTSQRFGENRLEFSGPDGENFALVESNNDNRTAWETDKIPNEVAIRGFHSASIRVRDTGATRELLKFMHHETFDTENSITRMVVENGNGAHVIDLEKLPSSSKAALQGAGSVHHIAFAVEDRAAQMKVREKLLQTGYQVTPVIDRDYFWAIYFRTPDGVLFEVSTNEPGFDRDEDTQNLGQALKLPTQHEHLRARLEEQLDPILD